MIIEMETQQGTPFLIANEQQHFRLIELPPELLDLLSNPDPPTLSLKSQDILAPGTGHGGGSGMSAHVNLCTAHKTYNLRSVQTSNSLFVVGTRTPVEHQADQVSRGITAIAQCGVTMELVPSPEDPTPLLRSLLPEWHLNDLIPPSQRRSKRAYFEGVPFSESQLEAAWSSSCAFEMGGIAYRPASEDLLTFWRVLLSASYAESIDLTNFAPEVLWLAVKEEEYPRELLDAVLRRLQPDPSSFILRREDQSIDREETIKWTASLILESAATSIEGMPLIRFLEDWRNLLPDSWRLAAKLDRIQDETLQSSPDSIILKSTYKELKDRADPNKSTKRKWHEKFRASRS